MRFGKPHYIFMGKFRENNEYFTPQLPTIRYATLPCLVGGGVSREHVRVLSGLCHTRPQEDVHVLRDR